MADEIKVTEKVKEPRPLTDKMISILSYLDANAGDHFVSDMASDGLTDKQLNPVCTTLVGRGFIEKGEKGVKEVVNKDGLKESRFYNTYHITDAGRAALAEVK